LFSITKLKCQDIQDLLENSITTVIWITLLMKA
jgi:hypothetical protein